MNALILAAGFGTRLGQYSGGLPKQLVPIHGRPVVEYIVRKLDMTPEVNDIYLLTNEKFIVNFEDWLSQMDPKPTKRITLLNNNKSSNEERNGSVGDILYGMNQVPQAENEGLLVIQGDDLTPGFSLSEFIQSYQALDEMLIIGHKKSKEEIRNTFGAIEIDPDTNRVTAMDEKPLEPKTDLANGGYYLFSPEAIQKTHEYRLELLKEHTDNTPDQPFYLDNTGKLFDWLVKNSLPMFVHHYEGPWFDIGKKEILDAATKYFANPNAEY